MDSNPSGEVIAAERTALAQRLCRFSADVSSNFARNCGVTVDSIKTDVIPLRIGLVVGMDDQ